MKRLLPLAWALAGVALVLSRLSAQDQIFTTGTGAELAQARSLALDRLHVVAAQRGIDASDLVVSSAHVDRQSMAHVRVQQRIQGIPVLGGEAIAHLNADGSTFADTDHLIGGITVSTTPGVTAAQAIDVAVSDYGCRTCLTASPSASLWIVRDNAGVDHLTYRVQMVRLDGTSQTALPVRFIDAHGGYVVLAYDNLQTGTGTGIYNGTVTFGTGFNTQYSMYVMEDLTRRVSTLDMLNLSDWSQGSESISNSTDVWNGPRHPAAVDAHYAAKKYLDYLQLVHGRNGIDGEGGPYYTYSFADGGLLAAQVVHFGTNYNNAFWEPTRNIVVYGDGDGAAFNPLVALDIAAHEMTHGVTQFAAGLLYQGESGAVNESWSDVFGAMLERYVRGESANTWLIAEEAYTPSIGGDALRHMNDPHAASNKGFTADDDPDHYTELYTGAADNGGVHINSGIANKAFYLLAKGGTHHLGGSMTGIGADAAARIWFAALTSYMTSSTDFAGAREATTLAAAALYGNGSTEQIAVARAWCLVGVGSCVTLDAVSVSPNAGSGTTQSFTLVYSDSAGVADLSFVRARFAASSGQAAGSCSISYNPTTAQIKLMDDAGAWGTPVPLGNGTLSNSQCTVNLASTTATPNGNDLTLVVNLTFNGSFTGTKNIYMVATSASGALSTGWIQRGTWTVAAGVEAISVTPNSASGVTQAFTLQYSDVLGATDLVSARVRFGSSNVGPGTCTARYNAANVSIALLDDAGTTWTQGTMGSGVLANSQCTLNLGSSSATPNGNDLTVVLNITFKPSFVGAKQIYMLAAGASGASSGWQPRGTWTVLPSGPAVISASPNSGTGSSQAFTLQYSDTAGAANITWARVRIGASNVADGTCTVRYSAVSGAVELLNDAGTTWASGVLGTGALSNSQCMLNLAGSSAAVNGTNLTLVLDLSFNGSFGGF
jgi:Zn-dependent metalloprotease